MINTILNTFYNFHSCPNIDDRYLTTLVPVDPSSGLPFPTHYRRFIFKMFTFVGNGPTSPSDPSKKAPSDAPNLPLKEHVWSLFF